MSNRLNTAYAVEVLDLIDDLKSSEDRAVALEALDDNEVDTVRDLLNEKLPEFLPRIRAVYSLGEFDSSPDLRPGVVYALYNPDEIGRDGLEALEMFGLDPREIAYTTFG